LAFLGVYRNVLEVYCGQVQVHPVQQIWARAQNLTEQVRAKARDDATGRLLSTVVAIHVSNWPVELSHDFIDLRSTFFLDEPVEKNIELRAPPVKVKAAVHQGVALNDKVLENRVFFTPGWAKQFQAGWLYQRLPGLYFSSVKCFVILCTRESHESDFRNLRLLPNILTIRVRFELVYEFTLIGITKPIIKS